ncbi:MAG: 50S ribosomal protein L24 [Robiginitomaculum sp.]|nr:MAG: 50S ribosomal protein L24 [Robiginitomaculum sp.]
MASKIKKGDNVIVLAGKDKGRKGEVMKVVTETNRAFVSGLNMVKRHTKPTQYDAGGIKDKEASLHMSNLAIVDPKTGEATRVGFKFLENGKKVRFAKKSGEVIDG